MADSRMWKTATAGTHEDARVPRGVAAVFVVAALVLVLVPFVGMAWARTDTTTENRELAAFPTLTAEDGSFNANILADLGTYFDDHYAYRNEAVTANARLRAALGTSATDQVVVGSDGWLYYGGTLPDYLGQGQLSDRALANIAHNLKLAQDYSESHGASFAFAIAPNKNSLDASAMPYYYLRYGGASNFERLKPYLDQAGVRYVDLFQVFRAEPQRSGSFGYLKLDSHWNNRWALLAANEMLAAVGHDELPLRSDQAVARADFAGDLQSMLYPAAEQLEENYYFEGYNDGPGFSGSRWSYEEGAAVTDGTVRTASADGQGRLLMFRDSFGNAALPYLAASYERALFTKLVPYNLTQVAVEQADCVIVERAERHLSYLASNPPIMANPARSVAAGLPEGAEQVAAQVEVSSSGSYWVVRGTVDDPVDASTRLYLVVEGDGADPLVFDPFWVSATDDEGRVTEDSCLLAYVPESAIDLSSAGLHVYRA